MKNKEYIIFGIILLVLIAIVFVTYRVQENAKNISLPVRGDFSNIFNGYQLGEVPLAGDNYDNVDYSNMV